ncbi:MAG TPA: response regulator [Clostridiales bacterium]|nr:response regulator [Clostridiales bacterium]
MRIGICDDNEHYLKKLTLMVDDMTADYEDRSIEPVSPDKLLDEIKNRSFSYDVFITDIDLGNYTGIELVKEINDISSSCIIIFISNHINFATQVYDVRHIYFVLKSEAEVRLAKALEKAFSIYQEQRNSFLAISYQNKNHRIALADITYIEAFGRYLYIHTKEETYTCIKTLRDISMELSRVFVKCHKSFIINMDYVRSNDRGNCLLSSGEIIPISTTYNKAFQDSFRQYIFGRLT